MKKRKKEAPVLTRVQRNGHNGTVAQNGATRLARTPVFKHPRTQLEAAIQRYVDLFDFAPIAYVSFDRSGRIEEVNQATAELLGRGCDKLIGSPFALHVVKEDAGLFLNHLLYCRSSRQRVVTELRLKKRNREIVPALLTSTPMTSSMRNGAMLFQTAIVDFTERKRAEQAIRESERRYHTLFDLVPVAVYACDANGAIKEFNRRAADLWGREPNTTSGAEEKFCGSYRIYYPDGRPMPHEECPMARALRGEQLDPRELEIIVERSDGDRRHVIPAPSILRNDRGEIVGAINSLHDITNRKRTEIALAEAGRRQQALYEFVQRRQEARTLRDICQAGVDAVTAAVQCDRAAVLLFDDQNKMRFVAWRRLSRRYRESIEWHSPWKRGAKNPQPICLNDVTRSDIAPPIKKAIRTEGIRAVAFIPLIREGELVGRFMMYYDQPHVFTETDLSTGLTIAGQLALGIERKRAAMALRESEELYRALVGQTAVGMARSNRQGRLTFANSNFCEMLGYTESELLGKSILEITHSDHVAESQRQFRALLREGRPYHLEKRYIRKDGSTFWVTVSASPMRDGSGKIQAAAAVVLNINERKQALLALEEANASLESRVKKRTAEFVAANEKLRDEIAMRKRLEGEILEISDREQRRLGQDLHDSLCQHLTATAFMARAMGARLRDHRVVEFSDLEKLAELINAGVTEARMIARGLHPVEMDEAGLVTALQSLLHRQSKLPYRLDLDEDIAIPDSTIALHLYRIAREAVINANKHSSARELVLRMRRSGKHIELSVTDDGVGIDKKKNGGGDGTGMGYHIMRYRARSIGARLEITSVKPHGTRVACYLPKG